MRRGQPVGPSSDQEIEEFICDALDLLPGANDVEVRCDGGRAVLTGNAQHKRVKRDAGEIAWAIPGISDVQNNITIVPRRRSRSSVREADSAPASVAPSRKQA
jgi:osmotically-inducible protein OsmY